MRPASPGTELKRRMTAGHSGRGWERTLSAIGTLVVAALAAIVLIYLVAAGVRTSFGSRLSLLIYWGLLLTGAIGLVLATALVTVGGRRSYSRALALCLAAVTLGVLLLLLIPFTVGDDSPIPAMLSSSWVLVLPALLVGTGAFLRFAALFPRPLTPAEISRLRAIKTDDSLGRADRAIGRFWRGRRERPSPDPRGVGEPKPRRAPGSWVGRLSSSLRRVAGAEVTADSGRFVTRPPLLWATVAILASAPYVVWFVGEIGLPAMGVEGGADALEWVLIASLFLSFLAIPLGLTLGIALLRLGHALAGEEDLRRMRWVLESLNAFSWGAIAMVPFLVLGMLGVRSPIIELGPPVVFGLLPLVVVTGLAVAVFYDGALEPALVVRKSTLYGLFGFGLAFLFALVEELVTRHLTETLGLPDGTGTLVASGAIAAVFGALHGRFRRTVDRNVPDPGPTSPALVDGDPAGRRR